MNKKLVAMMFLIIVSGSLFSQVNSNEGKKENPKVTFVELGSVNCIPCKQMQPVMKAIEEKYGEQVKVIFYDVWTDAGKPYASKYGIKLIPTQIFLDDKGKEFFRHEGFYPEKEIDKLLQGKGIKPINKKG
jgi:thioredoxin 1